MPTLLLTALAAVFLATLVISCWAWLHLGRRSRLAGPGGEARITGSCGDTLRLALTFENNRLIKGVPLSDGCAHAMSALLEVTRMARGMTPERIMSLEEDALPRTGGLDGEEDGDCARLAVRVLRAAAADYLEHRNGGPSRTPGG